MHFLAFFGIFFLGFFCKLQIWCFFYFLILYFFWKFLGIFSEIFFDFFKILHVFLIRFFLSLLNSHGSQISRLNSLKKCVCFGCKYEFGNRLVNVLSCHCGQIMSWMVRLGFFCLEVKQPILCNRKGRNTWFHLLCIAHTNLFIKITKIWFTKNR